MVRCVADTLSQPPGFTLHPIGEICDVRRDHRLATRHFLLAEVQRLAGDRLERIDVIKINALHVVHVRFDNDIGTAPAGGSSD